MESVIITDYCPSLRASWTSFCVSSPRGEKENQQPNTVFPLFLCDPPQCANERNFCANNFMSCRQVQFSFLLVEASTANKQASFSRVPLDVCTEYAGRHADYTCMQDLVGDETTISLDENRSLRVLDRYQLEGFVHYSAFA